jgi:hypothetical protein
MFPLIYPRRFGRAPARRWAYSGGRIREALAGWFEMKHWSLVICQMVIAVAFRNHDRNGPRKHRAQCRNDHVLEGQDQVRVDRVVPAVQQDHCISVRVAVGAGPHGATRRNDFARALERLALSAVHKRKPKPHLGLEETRVIRLISWDSNGLGEPLTNDISTLGWPRAILRLTDNLRSA